jgi:hypothetical protein
VRSVSVVAAGLRPSSSDGASAPPGECVPAIEVARQRFDRPPRAFAFSVKLTRTFGSIDTT